MPHELEAPNGLAADWDRLYLARGADEVVAHRPLFTGDVFKSVRVRPPRGEPKTKNVMVIQHPCAMRADGVELTESLLVAEARRWTVLVPEKWNTNGKIMPLPSLLADSTSSKCNQAAVFDRTYHAHPEDLGDRIACLSLRGVNLLLQRWVYHSSRVIVPSSDFNSVVSPAYEEADIVEEWSTTATEAGRTTREARYDANTWLDVEDGGRTRRKALEDPQQRSTIRRHARCAAATWRAPAMIAGPDDSAAHARTAP